MPADELAASRPTIQDLTGDNTLAQLARKYWLGKTKVKKVQSNVVKAEIWDPLEKENFPFQQLLLLEQLQLLDRYLWPGYSNDASDHHAILLALIVNVKRQEKVPAWTAFSSDPDQFPSFFRRVLNLLVDGSISVSVRTHLLSFVIGAFQSLDTGIIRKECASLVSIGIWHNLHSEQFRTQLLGKTVQLGKAWRAAGKRYDSANAETQARLRFERSWLYSLVLDFANLLYDPSAGTSRDGVAFCERMIEFLTDLLSQLPTRRYVKTLLVDLNLLPIILLSPVYGDESNDLLRDLTGLLQHFLTFPIEDHSGREYTVAEETERHNATLSRLQKVAIRDFKNQLTILALSNFKSLDSRVELVGHLAGLNDDELRTLCQALQLRTEYSQNSLVVRDRQFYMEVLVNIHERRPSFRDVVRDMDTLPTDDTIFETSYDRTESFNGMQPLAIPKLNLQYLTVSDFLWRSFMLHRDESFYEVRKHIQDTVRRLQPRRAGATIRFDGFSKMAIPISKPAVVDTTAARVGEAHPSMVQVEISLDVSRFQPGVRKEWESLRTDDVVYLVAVQPPVNTRAITNGGSHDNEEQRSIKYLRCAEVMQVLDEDGRPLRDHHSEQRVKKRRLLVKLDPRAYFADKQKTELKQVDIYDSINLIIRRRGRENNFKPVLESIQHLVLSETPAPAWLQEVFLGYSDPAAATYKRMPNRLNSIDYRDTFLDWSHLIESLPGKTVEPDDSMNGSVPPPYVLETTTAEVPAVRPSKKRRKDREEPAQVETVETVKVSTYQPLNQGPYPSDVPKVNTIRFTPAQVEAITSGTQPGLSVILGPPGTGKTDVATQIVSNLYHNFPQQRTLLIAHSNQALNQLFQKITALDVDERHLLRLGHGEEELETSVSYSKTGRIESLMEKSAQYLAQVDRLSRSIGAPGAHGNSCETAEHFDQVYVKPAWTKFWDFANSSQTPTEIVEAFPFHHFFVDAPQPLFPKSASRDQVIDIAAGCHRHLSHIFTTLSETRPFEILRSQRDKSNYLLLHSARIIAMTSTHAAMRRSEIASSGFRYDNIIIEESAQITEIETFIPFALQKPRNNDMPLQRIVLVGDHLQNSPVVQNEAFRSYANLDQSMFSRLTRLGVPTILLDAQGRARPSLAALYSWRYLTLRNLPLVSERKEFLTANAGFRHAYQFVDVPAYKGRGESTPSPHFVQNLGEAEYAVAIYQYMRLLGYPSSKITILTMYAGQKALIRDVLGHRCRGNRLFGMPKVSTVDRYQGEQNEYVILSLVRTERVGYLRDLRRLTVALSRARLGLYILGRRELFESVLELRPVFERLFGEEGGNRLSLVTGEMYPAIRMEGDESVDEEEGRVVRMEGVEHLGQYVYEMTKAKVEDLKRGSASLPVDEVVVGLDESDEEEGEEDEVDEIDEEE
ncbi:P-loop containing nucleoside triphosphate hydrolase protein [Myriangium duriaei CBS 260.36]|uniref:Pre-mRNA-splicing factor n=1 Tax=Myriangium duriaei CBS 260.36 TaxID=1168546 RepID=A0A9P4MI05_9PEZI|nr:P-loop containing nucleoside triphosphate hydrolase protein [Myriangium duriaei CBS 260.36]